MEGSSYLSDSSSLLGIFDPSACNELEAEIVETLSNSVRIEIIGYRLIVDVPYDLFYYENKICDRRLLIHKLKLVAFVGKEDNIMKRLTLKNTSSLEATVIRLEGNNVLISQNNSQIRVERSFIGGAELGVSVGDKVTLIKTLDRYIGCYLNKEPYHYIKTSSMNLIQKPQQPDLRENLHVERSIDLYGLDVQGKLAEDLIRNSPFNSINHRPSVRPGEEIIQPDLVSYNSKLERISTSSEDEMKLIGEPINKQSEFKQSRLEDMGNVWDDFIRERSGAQKSGELNQSQLIQPSNPSQYATNPVYKPQAKPQSIKPPIQPRAEDSIWPQAVQPSPKPKVEDSIWSQPIQAPLKPQSGNMNRDKLIQPQLIPQPGAQPVQPMIKPITGDLKPVQLVQPSSSNILPSSLVYNSQLPYQPVDQKQTFIQQELKKPELLNPAPVNLSSMPSEKPHQIANKPSSEAPKLFDEDLESKPKDLPNPNINKSAIDSKFKKGLIEYSKKLANLSLTCLNLILEIPNNTSLRELSLPSISKLYSDVLSLSLKVELENIKGSEFSELYGLEDRLKGLIKSTKFSEKVNICRECWRNKADTKLECGHSLCREDLVKLVTQHQSSQGPKPKLIRCAFCPKLIREEYLTDILKVLPNSNSQPSDLPKPSYIQDIIKPQIPQSNPPSYMQDLIKPQIPQPEPSRPSYMQDPIKPQIPQSDLPKPNYHISQPEPSRPSYMQDPIKSQIPQSDLPKPNYHIAQPELSRPSYIQDLKPQVSPSMQFSPHNPYSSISSKQDILNPQLPQSVSFSHHNPYASDSAAIRPDPKPVIPEEIYQNPYLSNPPARVPDPKSLIQAPICQICRKPKSDSVHKCLCDKCYEMLINQGITDCRFCREVLIEHNASNQCDNCHIEIDYSVITAGLNCANHKLCLTCIQKSVTDSKCVLCQRMLDVDEAQLLVDCYAGLCTICAQFYFNQYLDQNKDCNCRVCMNCKHQYGDQVKNICSCNLNKPRIMCTYCKNECSQDHNKLVRCEHVYCANCKRLHLSTLIQDKTILTGCDECAVYLNSELAKIRPQQEFKQSANLVTCSKCALPHSDKGCSKLDCGHNFCNPCLKEYLQYWITSDVIGRFIECPICKSTLKLLTIQNLDESLSKLYQAHISRRLGMNIFCPKCYILINPAQSSTLCQNEDCSFKFCIKCLSDGHDQNCDESIKYGFIENVRSAQKTVVCCSGCATPNFYDEKLGVVGNICRNPECNMMICDECGVLRCKIAAHGDSMHQPDCLLYNPRSYKQGFDPYKCIACKRLGRLCSER